MRVASLGTPTPMTTKLHFSSQLRFSVISVSANKPNRDADDDGRNDDADDEYDPWPIEHYCPSPSFTK